MLDPVYIGALFLMAIVIWQITGDGEAVAFEGWALVAIYVTLGVLTVLRVSRPQALDFLARELAPLARRKAVERQPRIAVPVQAANRMADRLQHPLHLVRATLVQRRARRDPGRAGVLGPARCGRPRARSPPAAGVAPRPGSPSTSAS